ncbi:MAG: N-acetylmuramoyl-L-alanine amidase, partial [Hyphomicrobiales bacterium]
AVSFETIRKWHMDKGWRDIGYHFVVGLDGAVYRGRPVAQVGAHVRGHNKGSIGICYVGGVTNDGRLSPKDTRTREQKAALQALLTSLSIEYPIKRILGHRDFAGVAKACPCFDAVPEYGGILELPELNPAFQSDCEKPAAKPLMQSTTIWSAAGTAVAGGASAIQAFEPWLAALIVLVVAGFAFWIMRERFRRHREFGE